MEQHGLITTLVAAIVLAFVFGFIAQRFRLAPIVGYLLAGFAVGPYSPGFTANLELALRLLWHAQTLPCVSGRRRRSGAGGHHRGAHWQRPPPAAIDPRNKAAR